MSIAEADISSPPAASRQGDRLPAASAMGLVVVAFRHMRRSQSKGLADTAADLGYCLGMVARAGRCTPQPALFGKGTWHRPFLRHYSPRLRQLMDKLDRDLKLLCRHRASRPARRKGITWACNQFKAARAVLVDVDDPAATSLCAHAKSLCTYWYDRWH
ncbi:MAG: hypothetical protein LLG01_02605 [Planctomycetaceae bacterium]|nr:hypothetical protein [Planctomycetaceae bacterium]